MIKNEHLLYTDKVNSNKDIMVISELHFDDSLSLGRINRILNMAKNDRPSQIIVPGDLYDSLESRIFKTNSHLRGFLNLLSECAPVYYVQGNSEQQAGYLPGFLYHPAFFLNPLVHVLGDFHTGIKADMLSMGKDFSIVGLGLDKEIYKLFDCEKPYEIACRYGKEISFLSKVLPRDKFTILVCHDPMVGEALTYLDIDPSLFDLIITGHRHGGEYPDELRTLLLSSQTFLQEAYPKYQSGFYDIDGLNGKLFVGSGVTEYTLDNKELEPYHESVVDYIRVRKN